MLSVVWVPESEAPVHDADRSVADCSPVLPQTHPAATLLTDSDACAPTIVVGLGNDIAGDDAVGILAARRLHAAVGDRANVTFVELPWAGFELLEVLRGHRRAILLDSLRGGEHRPGTVVRLTEADFAGSVRLNSFHDVNLPTAIALGRTLGWDLPERVEIFAIEGAVFDEFTERLSPVVALGMDALVRAVATALLRPGAGVAVDPSGRPDAVCGS